MHETRKLSAEEKSFAESNLGLVYSFMKSNGLDAEEFYDVVIFGFLKAVRQYHDRADLRQYTFATIAYKYMQVSLQLYFKKSHAGKRRADSPEIRLDANTAEEIQEKNHELYTTVTDFADDLVMQLYYQRILCKLKPEDRQLIAFMMDGYSVAEIAAMQKTSKQAVYQRITRIRQRLRP